MEGKPLDFDEGSVYVVDNKIEYVVDFDWLGGFELSVFARVVCLTCNRVRIWWCNVNKTIMRFIKRCTRRPLFGL